MKVLITGGTGTVGKALIAQNDNEYISISRNEENIANLKRDYPNVDFQAYQADMKGSVKRIK